MRTPTLSVVTHFYNQHDLVNQHISIWKTLPTEISSRIEFILIDDFSDTPIDISKEHLNLRLFKVTDNIDWNMPGCKNLGAFMSKADWLLFFDIDNFIEERGFEKILSVIENLEINNLYRFKRIEEGNEVEAHINTLLIHKKGFFKIGGLDEDFSGNYGYEDVHFNLLWNKRNGPSIIITDIAFNQINTRTVGLNRDTSINQRLGTEKIYLQNYSNSVGKLRFNWIEIDL